MCREARNAQLWRRLGFVAQLSISWPFQLANPLPSSPLATLTLFTNSCLPSFCPCYWCQRKISLTDSLQQMVLRASVAFYRQDSTIYSVFMHEWRAAGAIHADFLFSYTNRWDGRGMLINGLEQLARAASHLVCLLPEKFLSCIPSVLVGSHMSAKSYSIAIYTESLNFSILFSLAEIWWVAALFPVYKNYLMLLWQEDRWLLTWDVAVVVVGWTKYNIA